MDLVTELARRIGAGRISAQTDPGRLTDWLGHSGADAVAVVHPESARQVADVLRVAGAHGVGVQLQGGNTGLVRGGIPPDCGPPVVLLVTDRLGGIKAVDGGTGQLTAGAGATVAEVQRAAVAHGWRYGVDLASRDSATIGGTVATNAGGIRVCAYGATRAQLLGVEAVLADGSVISDLGGLSKDNTGYDLPGLLCGSEGTLAVITAVRVRLWRPPPDSTLVAVPTATLAEAAEVAATAAAPGNPLLAAEVVDTASWRGCAVASGLPDPLRGAAKAFVLLLEVGDGGDASGFSGSVAERAGAAVALGVGDKRTLWRLREGQTDYWVSRGGSLHKFDVSLPVSALDPFLHDVRGHAGRLSGEAGVFGHIREGNLHVQLRLPTDEQLDPTATILGAAARLGGSISAEHGVGREKARYLNLRRSATELAAMRAIKAAFDPAGTLNPGVLLD